jgi:magnesium-transporting ATPase (P-type)
MDAAAIAKPMSEVPAWHAVGADEVLRRLNTDPKKGLDTNEAAQRLSKYSPNRLPEGKKRSHCLFTGKLAQTQKFACIVGHLSGSVCG